MSKTVALPLRHASVQGCYSAFTGTIVWGCRAIAAVSLFTAATCSAVTYTVPSLSGASIQQTINAAHAAGSNNTVYVPAGVYNISSSLNLPCDNGLTITGPATTPATAILNASFSGGAIINLNSCSGVTIEYLQFNNTGGVYFENTNHSGVTITHNQFYGLPSSIGGGSSASAAVYLDGNINTTVTNFTATWNTFGDANSCVAVFSTIIDEGGYCAGIYAQPGTMVNPTVQYNIFNHVEEGIHYHQICDGCPRGATQSVTQNSSVQFNYFINFHRIAIEMQGGIIGSAQNISDNVLASPLNPSYGTMFISDACCTGGRTYLNSGAPNPANLTEDNLEWTATPAKVGGFWAPVIGIEYWGGAGSRANSNFLMGNFSNQVNWGFGVSPWYVQNNYLCGAHNGGYVTNEENSVMPVVSGNTTVATCTQQTSTASTISPASGAYSGSPTITLSNSGRNTSTYYTTDGSTPQPGSGTTKLYTGPFAIAVPATVKAVGMWGVPPQPTSYPAPYGFVPSGVATATYSSTSIGTPLGVRLSSAAISSVSGGHSLTKGSTMQLSASCNYSDGSTTNCTTADAHGSFVSSWSSSNGAVTIGPGGLASGAAAGSANIVAVVAGLTTPAWVITVPTPAVTLSSVSLSNAASIHSLVKGTTVQMTAVCSYSDGSTTNCTTEDSHNNVVNAWSSSSTPAVTLSATGMASAVAAGSANLTATVAGMTTPAWAMTVAAPSLTSVSLVMAGTSLVAGGTNQLQGTCNYSDGSTTNCTTSDANGNQVNSWTSSTPSVATVSPAGVVTGLTAGSTNLVAMVAPSANKSQWGQPQYDKPGETYPGYINATYMVLGNQAGGYSAQTCSFYLPAGDLTVGSQYDCGLISAPTPTTQATAWQCWYTYTVTNSTSPGEWVTGPLTNCGALQDGSAWWVAVVTNQPGGSPAGFHDCGNTCSGTAPASGNGTYPYRYAAAPYGKRTGMTTEMLPGGATQAAQYVTLGQPSLVSNTIALTVIPAIPTLASVYISPVGNASTLVKGGTLQFLAYGVYSDGSVHPLPDTQGDAVRSWSSSNAAVTIGPNGLASGVTAGSAAIVATVGSLTTPVWPLTVTPPAVTLSSVSLSNAGSVHSLVKGTSLQMTVTCSYSDQSTTNCTTADSHGNAVNAWTSSSTPTVTLSATGMADAVAVGSASLTATVAGMTTPVWAVTVAAPSLSSVSLGIPATSLVAGKTNQLQGTCNYSDGSTTNCTTNDVNGNQVNSWTSSAPSVATVSSAGIVTALTPGTTNLVAMVAPSTNTSQWGQPKYDTAGDTYPGFINATYMVLGDQPGGYSATACSFYLPPGRLTVGSQYDCGLVSAPTPTTQATVWQCWYTYTVTDSTSPGDWVTGPMTNCGTLENGSAWWVAVVTNQPGGSPAGFYDCGGSCSGSEPASGTGTYPYRYIAAPYGKRTGMTTEMLPGGTTQAAQYVTLGQPGVVSNTVALSVTPAIPTLASVYISSAGNASAMTKGSTLQLSAYGVYSDGSVQLLPDSQGNKVTLWNTSNHAIARISTLGHVTAFGSGTVTISALVGNVLASPRAIMVTEASTPVIPASAKAPGGAAASQIPQGPGALVADPFAGPLWALTAPAGGSASISQGHLFLGVPGGSNHDALSGQNEAVRVVQPIGDGNFDVSIKIDSQLSAVDASTSQGLMVVGDDRNYITYALETDGTKIGLGVHTVSGGQAASVFKDADLTEYQNPMYLRLTREGSRYVALYSVDGENWTPATSFSYTVTPTAIGPFAANSNDTPANAVPVVMSVNSFEVR